jgi:hypothetical protein
MSKTEKKSTRAQGHTPGPWEWSEDARELPEIFAPSGDALAEVYKAPGSDGARANARLIAAAPDLLEACEGMLAILEGSSKRSGGWEGAFADSVRAAIAKARGT